jgi:nucleoside-diphosphate-sugar epimerase
VPFRETQPLLGTSAYALAKIEGERRLQAYAERTGASFVVLRPGVVYGPGQAGNMLIPSVLTELVAGNRVALTLGEQTRDFVAVDDVVSALVISLRANTGSGTYNVGTGIETRVRDAATATAFQLSQSTGKDYLPQLAFGAKPQREHETARYVLDPDHAYQTLGWRATIPLAEGLKGTVRAFLAKQSAGRASDMGL